MYCTVYLRRNSCRCWCRCCGCACTCRSAWSCGTDSTLASSRRHCGSWRRRPGGSGVSSACSWASLQTHKSHTVRHYVRRTCSMNDMWVSLAASVYSQRGIHNNWLRFNGVNSQPLHHEGLDRDQLTSIVHSQSWTMYQQCLRQCNDAMRKKGIPNKSERGGSERFD